MVSLSKKERNGGIFYLLLQLFVLPSLLTLMNAILPQPLSEAQLNIVFFLLNFVCIVGIFRHFLWKNLPKNREQLFICLKYAFLGYFAYTIVDFLVSHCILWIQPDFANVNDAAIADMVQESFFLLNLCTVFLVPVTEECLFRGILFQEPRKHSRIAGYCCSVVLFAFVHVVAYIGFYDAGTLLLCWLQYVPAGIFLCWAYEKSNTIFAPILIHMTVNQMGILLMR